MLNQPVDRLREGDASPELTIPRVADWRREARWVEVCDRVSQCKMRLVERAHGRLPRFVVGQCGRCWPVAHLRIRCHVALQTSGDLTGPGGHVEHELPDGVNRRSWPTSRFVRGDIGEERCARGAVPGIAAVRSLELINEEVRQCWIRHAVMASDETPGLEKDGNSAKNAQYHASVHTDERNHQDNALRRVRDSRSVCDDHHGERSCLGDAVGRPALA